MRTAYLYAAKRTPIGSFMGALSTVAAPQLGATVAKAAMKAAALKSEQIDEVIAGCVLPAGLGQAPARQVCIFAGVPNSARALTINKVCGSGLKAISVAADRVALNQAQVVLAGGIENMSMAPYYLKSARSGMRMGHQEITDGMIHDGLWDVYNQFHMGVAAEICVKHYKFSREAQDDFARTSYLKAQKSIETGLFKEEIEVVEIASKKDVIRVETDEEPGRGKIDQFAKLKPAFDKEGTITAANASSLNDGAAFLVVGGDDKSLKPLARIIHTAEFAQAPEWFTTAPVGAIKKLLTEADLKVSDISSFEINEAFSAVAMAAQRELEIPSERLNPRGGAVALGHPIGASGARLMVTLLHTLKPRERGVASLCIGGGEAIAMVVEKL